MSSRNHTLDGIRGCLALDVFISHIGGQCGLQGFPFNTGGYAVWGFFALSGCVLVPGYDGRYAAFLRRRFVRLWPMYALCLTAGYALAHQWPLLIRYVFLPIQVSPPLPVDGPAWSLTVEWWAMLAIPVLVWIPSGSLQAALTKAMAVSLILLAAAAYLDGRLWFGICFAVGALCSRGRWHAALLETAIPQWLGRVSYPLYLSHALVVTYCPGPLVVRVAIALLAAEGLTRTVEAWSIDASRRVGKLGAW